MDRVSTTRNSTLAPVESPHGALDVAPRYANSARNDGFVRAPSPMLPTDQRPMPPIEVQARTLLLAVAAPGAHIPNADALVDYIIRNLVQTDWLSGLIVDLLRDGSLDRDLRHVVGVLLGLYGTPRFGESEALQEVNDALEHVDVWHAKLTQSGCEDIEWRAAREGCCPISCTPCTQLCCPVAVCTGGATYIFEAVDLLQWMQVSMQTPGRNGDAVNPLDRSALRLAQLRAVCWVGRPEE